METFRPKPTDYHVFEGYNSKFVKEFFSMNLIFFARSNFLNTNRIKNLEKIKKHIKSGNYVLENKKTEFLKENSELFFNSLIDDILISICFENYFKAKLLLKGFIIHEIIKDKDCLLFKKQKKEPILETELEFKENNFCEKISEKTINYKLLLENKSYNHHYDIDNATLKFLEKINKKRNNLHFQMNIIFELSNSEIDNLEKLKTIVDNDFVKLHTNLALEMEKIGGVSRRIGENL